MRVEHRELAVGQQVVGVVLGDAQRVEGRESARSFDLEQERIVLRLLLVVTACFQSENFCPSRSSISSSSGMMGVEPRREDIPL